MGQNERIVVCLSSSIGKIDPSCLSKFDKFDPSYQKSEKKTPSTFKVFYTLWAIQRPSIDALASWPHWCFPRSWQRSHIPDLWRISRHHTRKVSSTFFSDPTHVTSWVMITWTESLQKVIRIFFDWKRAPNNVFESFHPWLPLCDSRENWTSTWTNSKQTLSHFHDFISWPLRVIQPRNEFPLYFCSIELLLFWTLRVNILSRLL